MPSERYQALRHRIDRLRNHLIPETSPVGDYSEAQRDMAAGFRLLVHAEIEAFIEDSVRELALKAITSWETDGTLNQILIGLLSHFPKRKVPQDVFKDERAGKSTRIHYTLKTAHTSYVSAIRANHGIRDENLRKILFPLGVKQAEIGVTWLNTMDSFGASRGAVAHNSAGAIQPVDPDTEIKTVEQILEGLENLDMILTALAGGAPAL